MGKLMAIRIDLATETGRQILTALTWDILRCDTKATRELPLQGAYDTALWDVFAQCENMPTADEVARWHRVALKYSSQSYHNREAASIASAFGTLIDAPLMPTTISEVEAGHCFPETPDAAVESEWGDDFERLKCAVADELGNGDYERTPLFRAIQRLGAEMHGNRAAAITWGSLCLYLQGDMSARHSSSIC